MRNDSRYENAGRKPRSEMLNLLLPKKPEPLRLLCLGAHADDLEIGCGGTLLTLLETRKAAVHWVVLGCTDGRSEEARSSSEALLDQAAERQIEVHDFRDGFFPYLGGEVKEIFEDLKGRVSPDLIFTNTRADLHQDHRLVNELTWNTFRNHLILEYEVPKYDGDLGSPNLFVEIDTATCSRKIDHLMEFFPSQKEKHWFDEETFRGLMRLRGVEAGCRYAEGFYCRKMVLGPEPIRD